MNKRTLAAAFLSGLFLVFVFPKFGHDYLVWIALVPLFCAIRNAEPGEAFRLGMITGLVFNTGLVYWIVYVVTYYGNLPIYLSLALMFVFAAYLALYMGLFALGTVVTRKRGLPILLAAPFLWTALEYVKSNVLTGFPWANLGYALHERIHLIQIADITGVYGLSFFIVFINCIVFDLLTHKNAKGIMVLKGIMGLVVIATVLSYGFYRADSVNTDQTEGKSLSVALIQGDIDQSVKWDPAYQKETIRIYGELTREASEQGVDFIIWPETAAPIFFQDINDNHREILAAARESGAYLLFGSPGYRHVNGEKALLNSAWLVSPRGDMIGRYDKTHLVPFGEYVPLRGLLFFVDKMVEGFADFIPGDRVVPLKLNDVAAGVLICYEGIFPAISRAYVRNGADYLVNITNDAWYGRTSAPYQHASMISFRAVENRRSVARAANTGISLLADPLGRVSHRTGLFERKILLGTLKKSSVSTFYTNYGDLFAMACCLTAVILLFWKRRAP